MSRQDSPKQKLQTQARVSDNAQTGIEQTPWKEGSPAASPAQQTQLARPVLVHDDAQRQRDGRQQEGADGEGQVQHLVLVLADQPAVHPQLVVRGHQGPHLHPVSQAHHRAVGVKVLHGLVQRRRRQQLGLGQVEAGAVGSQAVGTWAKSNVFAGETRAGFF